MSHPKLLARRVWIVLATQLTLTACEQPTRSPEATSAASGTLVATDPEAIARAAWARFRAGDSTTALDGLEQAAALYTAAGDVQKELETGIDMAVVISEIGAPGRAIERLRSIRERSRQLALPEVDGVAGVQLARSLTLTGDFAAAHASLESARLAFEQAGLPEGPARVAEGRSFTLLSEGQHLQAIVVGEQAADECERAGLEAEALRARAVVAYALQQTGNEDEAFTRYLDLLELAWQNDNQRLIQFVYCNLAEIKWRRGRPKPAEEELWATIVGLETSRAASPATPQERAAFLSLQVPAYDRLIRLLADTYRGVDGFNVAERFHALSLRETLRSRAARNTPDAAAPDPPVLRDRERQLLTELSAKRLALDGSGSEAERRSDQDQLNRLQAELAALQIERQDLSSAVTDRPPLEPPDAEQVRAALKPGEVLVAYWVSEERLLAWVLTPDHIRFVEIPLSRQRLGAAISDYLSLLRSPHRAEDAALKGEESQHLAVGMELYRWLIGSLPPEVAEAEILILIPDDQLHRLPFESLIESCEIRPSASRARPLHAAYRDCRFLGMHSAIAYNPSAGVFLELRQRADAVSGGGSVLAMAPAFSGDRADASSATFVTRGALPRWPLIHAADEVRRVAKIFDSGFASGTSEVGRRATEARFKTEAGRHRYLHLATHGLVDDALPMVSGLLLEPGDGEDGLLQAYEVRDLQLSSELVTLSACRSGRGELSRGEGIIGLARAFLTAGASSVLVSQWDVDDRSTPDLMETFYRRLNEGATRAEALRGARSELFDQVGETQIAFRRRSVSYAHPRYWSAFVLIGAP